MKNLPQYSDHEFPHEYDVLALSFLILAAYASPLLFGYRSKRVKREMRKFFCFHRELSYKNNRSLMAKKVLKRRHSSTLSHLEMDHRYNIFNCVYGRSKWPKEKVQFVQVPDTALAVETCRSSFSSGASTQISSTSTEEC
ncbi:adenosine receptor a2b [Lasius niger]|uniref:Adenosine receptor a2b n=2 Tax=Lasius TaxID=488720 RepID=A0A0J7KVS8_LASNI|nr:adenosine receptor a2b [Lasius niger]